MSKVYVIAEIGVNHNGSFDLACKMIDRAMEVGANAAKFQIFKAENVLSPSAEKAQYQKESVDDKESQLDMVKKLQLDYDEFDQLKLYCENAGIDFICSPFDEESFNYLLGMGVNTVKIPSGEITNVPLLRLAKNSGVGVILSTGMATLGEVEGALVELGWPQKNNISLLHCNTDYPTNYCDVNLKAMQTLGAAFNLQVGYSDHTVGAEVSIAAVAMGATIIEKHFTLDNALLGPDHKASMNPQDFSYMVSSIRNIEQAIGHGLKIPSKSEVVNTDIVRKSIVARQAIEKGSVIKREDIDFKRPGSGIPSKFFEIVVGMTLNTTVKKDEVITWEKIK